MVFNISFSSAFCQVLDFSLLCLWPVSAHHQTFHQCIRSCHSNVLYCTDVVGLDVFQVQVDEYKQLKETLNKMPSLRHESAQLVQNRNAEEPHQPQDAQPEVLKLFTHHTFKIIVFSFLFKSLMSLRSVSCGSRQAEKHDEVQKPQSQHREEEGEMGGAEERRRELAEEEMEQAGLPQKLEEEFDVAHNEAGEEEPKANQPDENALEREQHHGHEVRTLPNTNIRPEMPENRAHRPKLFCDDLAKSQNGGKLGEKKNISIYI